MRRHIVAAVLCATLGFAGAASAQEKVVNVFNWSDYIDPTVLERRLDQAEAEEAQAADFDAVVVNDDLSRAVDEVAAILQARRESP